jgi:hypothetical protein
MSARNAWDRRTTETNRSFAAFRIYLEQGYARSAEKVGKALGHRSGHQSERWATKHDWVDRAAAWDQHHAQEADLGSAEVHTALSVEHAERLRRQLDALDLPAVEAMRRFEEHPELMRQIPFEQVLSLAATSARAVARLTVTDRLVHGMTTDAPGRADDDRFSRMNLDELDAYLAGVDDGRAAEAPAPESESA